MINQGKLNIEIEKEFTRRKSRNSHYSMRAMAKDLKISPSCLSETIGGKRKLGRKVAERICSQLGLDPELREDILLYKKRSDDQSKKPRVDGTFQGQEQSNQQTATKTPYKYLNIDTYHAISEWHHFAILSMAEDAEFTGEADKIAKVLCISKAKAKSALERLERMELLGRDREGRLVWTGRNVSTSDDICSEPLRQSLKRDLELAREAIDNVPIDQRYMVGMTMYVDPDRVPQAKKYIRRAMEEISDLMETGRRKQVYKINVNLFPLSSQIP